MVLLMRQRGRRRRAHVGRVDAVQLLAKVVEIKRVCHHVWVVLTRTKLGRGGPAMEPKDAG